MAYSAVESAVKTLLDTCTTNFKTEDISQGNYDILDNGDINHIVITPGSFGSEEITSRTLRRPWDVMIDVFTRFSIDNPWTTFETARAEVIAKIDNYPSLNNPTTMTVQDFISSGDPTEVYDKQNRGPFHIFQRLRLTVVEKSALTEGEYA